MTGTENLLSRLVIKGRECRQRDSEDSKARGDGKRPEASLAGLVVLLTGSITVHSPIANPGQETCEGSASESVSRDL